MHRNTKVATCCYCGTRAALVLGKERHELVCSTCGAPLHDLKRLPGPEAHAAPAPTSAKPATSKHVPAKHKKKKTKKRKAFARWLVEEAFDTLEDIFD